MRSRTCAAALLLPLAANCGHDDEHSPIVIDDVLWLTIIILIAGACAWLCCFWDAAPPAPCCRHPVIHVRIERADAMQKRHETECLTSTHC
jgi:hypothetical protein